MASGAADPGTGSRRSGQLLVPVPPCSPVRSPPALEIDVNVMRRGRSTTQVQAAIATSRLEAGPEGGRGFGSSRRGPSFVDVVPPEGPPPLPLATRPGSNRSRSDPTWPHAARFDSPPRAAYAIDPLDVSTHWDRIPDESPSGSPGSARCAAPGFSRGLYPSTVSRPAARSCPLRRLAACSGSGRRGAVPVGSDRLYRNVCIGLRIAGEETIPRNVRGIGMHRGDVAGFGWLMRYGPPGQAGRQSTSIQSARPVNC